MREITYSIIAGPNGKVASKKASLEDLVIDTGMFINYESDKVIPKFPGINKVFFKGSVEGRWSWEPFNISGDEYHELVERLISLPIPRPYRVEE